MQDELKKIMAFGTFDGLHPGHIDFLKQCRSFGDYLLVVVARDKNVKKLKGKMPIVKEDERLKTLVKSRMADEVVLGKFDNKYSVIEYYKPNVICLGYDQEFFVKDLPEKLKEFGMINTEIVRLKPFEPEKYKSSIINKKI